MKPWGCHNTKRVHGYMVKDGIIVMDDKELGLVAEQKMTYIEDTSTKECQYRKEQPADRRCNGCVK